METIVWRRLARALGGQNSRDACQIHGDGNVGPTGLLIENSTHVFRGIMPEFEDEDAAVSQQIARLFDQPAVNFDAGAAAEKRLVRFVLANFALQAARFFQRNIRWVADNYIEERFRATRKWARRR